MEETTPQILEIGLLLLGAVAVVVAIVVTVTLSIAVSSVVSRWRRLGLPQLVAS